jgi:hypothetical protein
LRTFKNAGKVKINEVNVTQGNWAAGGDTAGYRSGRNRGKVVQISPQGERLNNVVTYLTTVEVQDPDEMETTMTANVDIISNERCFICRWRW